MNKRKQKLETKTEDIFSAEKDLFIDYDVTADWFSSSNNSDLDITSNVIYDDDFLNLLDIPLSFEDEPLSHENKEIFQDLCCTSTPKASRPSVSKIYVSGNDEPLTKKICKGSDSSHHVLEDITGKLNSINNSSNNLSHISDSRSIVKSNDTSLKKHVNILRKDFVLQSKNNSSSDSTRITQEQMIYYTGIKNYDIAIAVLKHIKMPKCEVSSFKMELMALMKLRLDLPLRDMSYRFSISEKSLKELLKKTFYVMSYSLEDLLPWHSQKKLSRKSTVKTYCVYSLISGESSHNFIVLTESKKPVLYVSENYNTKVSALSVILNSCSSHLIPGDVLCVTDASGINMFYTVNDSNGVFILNSPSQSNYSVVGKCRSIMTELLSEFSFLTKQNDSFEVSQMAKVACAIINLNFASEVSSYQLQQIFERSSAHAFFC